MINLLNFLLYTCIYTSSGIFFSFFCYELERERLEKERASKRPLSIKNVDMNIADNCKAHHTDKFELTQLPEDKRELVIRRGQEFSLILKLDQEYDKAKHDLVLHFTTGIFMIDN